MAQSSAPYHSQGLARGMGILKTLGASSAPMTLVVLSKASGIPKPTLVRLLSVMEAEDFVVRVGDPPAFAVGSAIFDMAAQRGPIDFPSVVSPVLKELADSLGFTTNLGVLQGRSVLHVAVEEPQRALRLAAGGILDETYCTALGKSLLSELPPEAIEDHLPDRSRPQSWQVFTNKTLTNIEELRKDLERSRERGYSIDDEERHTGVRCMGALVPLRDRNLMAISASGPAGELSVDQDEMVKAALSDAAQRISKLPKIEQALSQLKERWGKR